MTYVSADQETSPRSPRIKLHGPADFEPMREAGRLTAEALDLLVPHVKPGVTTEFLDRLVSEFARDHKARSEEHTSELQSRQYLVCRLLLGKNNDSIQHSHTLSG